MSINRNCVVFKGGQEGFPTYRIPSLLSTNKGTLLAICEGRASIKDQSSNKLVLKRSHDEGTTWSQLDVIANAGNDSLNNPCLVQDQTSGRILLHYQRYPHPLSEHGVKPGIEGEEVCHCYQIVSDDDGKSWSQPEDITRRVKRPSKVTSMASGPGIGIQLTRGAHRGRILIPFNQGPYGKWKIYVIYSDDGGASWEMGNIARGKGNEVQVVELGNGDVMLNARNVWGNLHRVVGISHDQGLTWDRLYTDKTLVEPHCMASLLRYAFGTETEKSVILFANPASKKDRTNGTLRVSYDEGRTWPVAHVIHLGRFAYSSLARLPSGVVGCLYETGEKVGYEQINFMQVKPFK